MMRRIPALALSAAVLALLAIGASGQVSRFTQLLPWAAPAPLVDTELLPGVAIAGYDAVTYFSAGGPQPGNEAISLKHNGVVWRFASAANREAFRANPARFAPQYGGHCAWATAGGYTAKGDPLAWKIVDGRLFLNYDLEIKARWETDIPGFIVKGDANWPKLTAKK